MEGQNGEGYDGSLRADATTSYDEAFEEKIMSKEGASGGRGLSYLLRYSS